MGVLYGLGRSAEAIALRNEMEALLAQVNANLPDYARLQMIVVAAQPWTIENGCLTPTMKIKRARIEDAVAPQVEGMVYNPLKDAWSRGRDSDVNYLAVAVKPSTDPKSA